MNIPEATTTNDLQLLIQQLQLTLDGVLQENKSLKQQLGWFKRQLFGEKSEKRLIIDNPDQIDLGEIFAPPVEPQPIATETITYERRKKQRPDDCVTDQWLRYDRAKV